MESVKSRSIKPGDPEWPSSVRRARKMIREERKLVRWPIRWRRYPTEEEYSRGKVLHCMTREELYAHYLDLLPLAVAAAWEMGYALAVHGSMRRDLDLVAVPWILNAASEDALAEAIRAAVGGYADRYPVTKEHGRRAHCINIHPDPSVMCPGLVDLSILPRLDLEKPHLKYEPLTIGRPK